MTISVTRYSFFNARCLPNCSDKNLRFTEHAPSKEEYDHPICCCTSNVSVRPTGEPSSVSQLIEFVPLQLGKLRTEFGLHNGWITFRWDMTPEDIEKCIYDDDKRDPHAYFMFHPSQRSVKIQVMVPGYGLTDCFFADLYMGNQIDVSRFINGHSKSEMVNLSGTAHKLSLSPITNEDLWLHKCNLGVEAMRVLEDSEEARAWRDTIIRMERLHQLMAKYRTKETFNWPIEDVREDVRTNLEIFEIASRVANYCEQVVLELQATNLFRLEQELDQELKDAHA